MDIDILLDECIDRINKGESIEECLTSFPEQAGELEPRLRVIYDIRESCSNISGPAAKSNARQRLNAAMGSSDIDIRIPKWKLPSSGWIKVLAGVASLAVVLMLLNNGLHIFPRSFGSPDTTGPSTKVIPQPGDNVSSVTSMLAPLTLDDLVERADAILIGEVVEILPAKWGKDAPGHPIIYTDVIIQPERYLYGKAESGNVAIWLRGGRVGNNVAISESQAVFYLGEKVLVFLFNRPNDNRLSQVPEGISPLNYYLVTGSLMGKWNYADGKAMNFKENVVSISHIEKMIAETRSTKEQ